MKRWRGSALVGIASILALAGCTGGTDDASSTPEPSVSETATASASPTPSTTPSATSSATPDGNDPGDGVATDPAIATPSATAGQGRAAVDVALTRYGVTGGEFSAAGFVQGIAEDGGRCTVTLTRGAQTVTASGLGLRSATSTDCGDGLFIDAAELSSGDWSLVLSYRSDSYEGSSAPTTVSIP